MIGKHDGTGGAVTLGTVTSQLLYEIGGAAYPGPDVTARFDTIRLDQVGVDRVRVSEVKGEPPPRTLKVGINRLAGYRNGFEVALTGLDIEAKAEFAEAAFWDAAPLPPEAYDEVASTVVRTDHPDPDSNERATAVWRVVVKDRDEEKVGRSFSDALVATALASIPGMYSPSGPPRRAEPFGVFRSAVIDGALVPQLVHRPDGTVVEVDSAAPVTSEPSHGPAPGRPGVTPDVARGPTARAPLGRLVGARSGDKGGDANLGLFVRDRAAYDWMVAELTVDRLQTLLPETAQLDVERHLFPNLASINFVVRGLLGEGVAASTRPDPQAKSLGEWLRARIVDIPVALLTDR